MEEKSEKKQRGTWLENTIANTESDESKLEAMALICRRVKLDRRSLIISSLVFRLFLFLTSFATLWGCIMLIASQEERAIFDTLPEVAKNILQFFDNLFHVFYEAFFKWLSDFDPSMTADIVSIISAAVSAVVLIFILTPVIGCLVRFVIRKLPDGKSVKIPSKWNGTRAAAQDTFKRLTECQNEAKSGYSTWQVSALLTAAVLGLSAYLSINGTRTPIWYYVVNAVGFFLIFQLIGILPKLFVRKNQNGSRILGANDTDTFEKYWIDFDPEKKAEVERLEREAAERRRREREERERRELEEKKRPTITFDATGAHYANSFSVYIDGSKNCSFSGGQRRNITVSPGRHRIQVTVYNDAAESAYSLAPMDEYFEEYGTCTIDLG